MYFEKGHTILFTRYTLSSADESIIPEFNEKIELLGLSNYFEITKTDIISKATGSKIMFRGIKASSGIQTAKLKSLNNVTTWVMDEAEELVDEQLFDKINLSIRKKGNQNRVIFILNPATKEHWIYKKFFEDKGVLPGTNTTKDNITYIHTTYLDNLENLDEGFLNDVEQTKLKNKEKYEHQVMGGWLDKAEGVIYTNWTIGNFDYSLPNGFGLDYGYKKDETALIQVAVDNKNMKLYVKEHLYQSGLKTHELHDIIKPVCHSNLIVADHAEGRLNDELKDKGLNIVPCTKGAGSIVEGIKLIQDYQIIVDPSSTNIVRELNNYVWTNKAGAIPRDLLNHACDAIRYYVSHITKNKPIKNLGFVTL
jgi:phage terminase large subunit